MIRALDPSREIGIAPRIVSGERFVVAAAAVIVRSDEGGERVLAMRRAPGKDAAPGSWETCSGRVAPDEQPRDAIVREIVEETGLVVAVADRPSDAYAMRRGEHPMVVVVYRAEWITGEVVRSDEHDEHGWWTREEVRRGPMPERLIAAVLRAWDDGWRDQPSS